MCQIDIVGINITEPKVFYPLHQPANDENFLTRAEFCLSPLSSVGNPDGFYQDPNQVLQKKPDPDPTFQETPDPDPAFEKITTSGSDH